MKTVYKRQRQQFLFAAGLGAIAVVNLLFFFILYRPTKNQYYRLQTSIERLRGDIQARRQNVDRLERLGAQLETSEQDRQSLYLSRFNQRNVGYSKVLPELQNLAVSAGVRKNHVGYTLATIPQYGLYSVKISFSVQGGYANVVRFIQELERAETFFIIEGIDVQAAAENATSSAGNSGVSLTLAMETFFYQ
jgi:Tfp pilus assembly protein PilO